jgi:hypothetical protein
VARFGGLTVQGVADVQQRGGQAGGPGLLGDQPVVLQYVQDGRLDPEDARQQLGQSTRTATAEAFTSWRRPPAEALTALGVPAPRATPLATLVISGLEGALLLARAERSPEPPDTVAAELAPLLDSAVQRSRPPPPNRVSET